MAGSQFSWNCQMQVRIAICSQCNNLQELNLELGLVRRFGLSTPSIETLTRFLRPRVRKLPAPFALSLTQQIPRTNESPRLLVLLQLGWLNSNLSASAHITIQQEMQNMNLNLK